MKAVFDYKDYRKFLEDYIESQPNGGRGVRRHFAEACGCQVAYISHVLGNRYDFSPEQIEAIARHIGLGRDETEYLVLLVEMARAGTQALKQFFQRMLSERIEKHLLLKNRVKISETLSVEDQAAYYSKWHYSAIHIILTIPAYRTAQKIAEYLALPMSVVRETLDFLEQRGLIEQERAGGYKVKGMFLYLDKKSVLMAQHHTNWRLQAVKSLTLERENDLHFSSCFSVSADDASKLRALLSKTIEESMDIVKPSKEEKICAFNVDFFEL